MATCSRWDGTFLSEFIRSSSTNATIKEWLKSFQTRKPYCKNKSDPFYGTQQKSGTRLAVRHPFCCSRDLVCMDEYSYQKKLNQVQFLRQRALPCGMWTTPSKWMRSIIASTHVVCQRAVCEQPYTRSLARVTANINFSSYFSACQVIVRVANFCWSIILRCQFAGPKRAYL